VLAEEAHPQTWDAETSLGDRTPSVDTAPSGGVAPFSVAAPFGKA